MSITIEAPRTTHDLEVADIQPASAEVERQAESVIKLLQDRAECGYQRGIDDDGHKIGLAFDGGGLAGVVSAAMARKLEVLGLLDYVDAFYGLSAGSFNALYAACGRLKQGIDIYKDIAPDEGLVTPGKTLPPKLPSMNLDVLREAFYHSRPIDVNKIVSERIPVVIGATDLSNPFKRNAVFRSTDLKLEDADQLIEQALAGGHIPMVSGPPIELENGHTYTDATMSWENTVELAIADGCTDILSLANFVQPEAEPAGRKAKIGQFIFGSIGDKYLDSHGPKLPPHGAFRHIDLKTWVTKPIYSLEQALLSMIDGDSTDVYDIKEYKNVLKRKEAIAEFFDGDSFVYRGANVERLYPPDIPDLPELLTMDKKKLRVGIKGGRLAVRKALIGAKSSSIAAQ